MKGSATAAGLLLLAGFLFGRLLPTESVPASDPLGADHAAVAAETPVIPAVLQEPATANEPAAAIPAVLPPSPDAAAEDALLEQVSNATTRLAARVLEATVHFEASRRGEGDRNSSGTGSGFVLDAARGICVTNNHVVGSREATVRVRLHDGRVFDGLVLGTDPPTDLAVVQIPEGEAMAQLAWGDSDALRPGTWVMAVGNPLGEIGTTSIGVISGLHRTPNLPNISYENFLQFDAYIDRGSSGGPLVDTSGRVVGINTAIAGQAWQGVGYAVPSAMARSIVDSLVRDERVRRGYLGITPRDVGPGYAQQIGLSRPYGARVTEVTEDSPADRAGLRRGDVILAIDGKEVASDEDLRARVSTTPPGTAVRFRIWRDRAPMTIRVVLGELDT